MEYNNSDKFNIDLYKASGEVQLDSKLVSFLYELLRDHIQPADMEKVMRNSLNESEVAYTNGWLAQYALYIANRLTK